MGELAGIISLVSLAVVIILGYFLKVNTGIMGLGMAFLVGTFICGSSAKAIIAGFPTSTFVTLLSMTLFFSCAKVNGTMEILAVKLSRLAKGNQKLIPLIFFLMSAVLSAVGAGPIVTPALICPIAASVGKKEGLSDQLMIFSAITGALAGGLTPLGPSGIVATGLAAEAMKNGYNYAPTLVGMAIVAILQFIVAFTVFGGFKLGKNAVNKDEVKLSFKGNHYLTLVLLLVIIGGKMILDYDIALLAFLCTAILLILKGCDEKKAIAGVPWGTLLLVGGVSVLVKVIYEAGGINTMVTFLQTFMNEGTASPIMALCAGLLSAVSSASGVVMPTFIPTVPDLASATGAAEAMILAGICIGAHAVTISPFSTVGALGYAAVNEETDKLKFFNHQLLFAVFSVILAAVVLFIGILNFF